MKAAAAALAAAVNGCKTDYGWNDEKAVLAENIGLYGALIGWGEERLLNAAGIEPSEYAKIADVLNDMPQADLQAFSNGGWRADKLVQARVANALINIGIPSTPTVLGYAFYYMEGKVVTMAAETRWATLPRS
jgi:hypothetical protein